MGQTTCAPGRITRGRAENAPPKTSHNRQTNQAPPRMSETSDFDVDTIRAIEDPIARLRVIMKRLLDPGGCPWDREQSHETLKQYLIEEAYEACEAIESGDSAELCEELGDVALQIIFHAELAERAGRFKLEDVYQKICDKLIYRHPHVFGSGTAEDSEEVLKNWEQLKQAEKRDKAESAGRDRHSALDGVPVALPGLQRAQRLQEKASRVGFDWTETAPVVQKVREEVEEFLQAAEHKDEDAMKDELGDLLFSLVNLSRFLNISAEDAVAGASRKFTGRFHKVEAEAERQGRELKDMSLEDMDDIWNQIKQ